MRTGIPTRRLSLSPVSYTHLKEQLLDEKIVKDIHALLMENIFVGGIYRNVDAVSYTHLDVYKRQVLTRLNEPEVIPARTSEEGMVCHV